MLAKCYSKTPLEDSIQHYKMPATKLAVKGSPEFYAHIDLLKFQEELQFNLFVHPQTFSLIGFSLFDSEKEGWELGNWNTFWETYNLTQFHGINTLSITELTEQDKEGKSHLQHILENFDTELHGIVITLIENKININEEFDFDLLDGEEIIAQAELGSHESKFYIKPFDEESKKIFLKNGYKELIVESFDIKQIIT